MKSATKQPLHACFFYESNQQRHEVLANYFQEGLDQNELCIFVTPETPRQVIASFKRLGHNVRKAVANGALRIFDMDSSYLSQGQFVADFMMHNVKSFMEDAKSSGYSGLRTAGEMAWLYNAPEFSEEATQYERDVNTLTTPDTNFTGIYLYPTKNATIKIIADAMHTHPGFIYDGSIRSNLDYKPVA